MALSDKHRTVADEYLKCFNRSDAYMAVYPTATRNTAKVNAHRLWQNPDFREYLSQRLSETAMSADEVLMRLAEQARGAHAKYIKQDGTVDIAGLVKDNKAHLIKKVEDTKDGRKYEFNDSQSALALLGKHHKLFTEQSETRHYDIDLSKLSNEQLERVAAGEDVLKVIIDGYLSTNQSSG